MTCLNHYPRSATVRCIEAGEVLEIDRNILYALQRNRTAREIFDKAYRERVLENHLSGLQLFSGLEESQRAECIQFLRNRVDLLRVDKGQVIFRQGERADHFYSVRLGFVKVSQLFAGQERVSDYLGPGGSFGEIGLLSTSIDLGLAGKTPPVGLRTATCAALDDVELVRIRGEDFRALLDRYPVARDKMVERAKRLVARDVESRQSLERPLGEFLEQGLFNAQKLLVLDLDACTRCDECTRACADTHDGVTRLIREGLRYDKFLVASSCRSCLDPYCLVGCPVDSIHRRPRGNDQNSLEIVIESWCIGCGQCAKNCPYGNINMQQLAQASAPQAVSIKATTCDLCRDVVSADKDPSCVYACPHNAAFRMSGPELLKLTSRQ
jgi:CRP-like cAMP-binding protein/Fe-S-cluster-containing dehydrogenase component